MKTQILRSNNSPFRLFQKGFGLIAGLLLLGIGGCKPESYFNEKNTLSFSKDTVWFDTVFTRKPGSTYPISVTKIISVKNPENLAVKANFKLAGGAQSQFRVSIDGESGIESQDIEIEARDSVFVFVQCKLEPNNSTLPVIVLDSLIAEINGEKRNTKLAAYGWDANYYHDTIFDQDVTWNNNGKPYVIVGYLGLTQGSTMTINAGVQVFASARSTVYVGGTLNIKGTASNRVSIRGDKPVFETQFLPNQWGGIHYLIGSTNNSIAYADITNATIGLRVDSLPVNGNDNLVLTNTQVQYCGQACLLGITAHVKAINCLFADAGSYTFLGLLGGKYAFNHCTFAEYSGISARNDGHFAATNTLRNSNGQLLKHQPLECIMNNSIVFGYNKEELEIDQTNLSPFVFDLENNLLKSQNPNGILTKPNTLNQNPKFLDTDRGNYQIDSTSAGYKKAAIFGVPVVVDLLGNTRKSQPDLGCYEKLP
jgi:hypothetical protein